MHSAHSRHGRQRASNGDVDDMLHDSRQDAVADVYNRHQYTHGSDNYRPAASSARASYTRETSSSRHHDEWRRAEPSYSSHDRHSYSHSNDPYSARSNRDEYEAPESRDSEGWSGNRHGNDTHYVAEDRGWGQRYDRGPSTSSYTESTSWTTSASYEARGVNHDQWPEDIRGGPSSERSQVRTEIDERHKERDPGWRKHGRKDGRKDGGKGDPSTWRSDSGWQSRRSGNQSQVRMEPARKNIVDDYRPPTDDRSWEPAPAWQSQKRGGAQGQGNQKDNRNSQLNKNSKGRRRNRTNKQEQQQQQHRRDWLSDDSSLNK